MTLINLQYWSVSASLSPKICFWRSRRSDSRVPREMGEREKIRRQRGSPVFFFPAYIFAPSLQSEGLEQAITSRFKTNLDLDPGGPIELN